MWRHTKVKVSRIEGVPMAPMCLKFGAIPTVIYKVTAFWKKWHTSFFFDRPPSWKCQSNHTGFQTYPSPKWKMADPRLCKVVFVGNANIYHSLKNHSNSGIMFGPKKIIQVILRYILIRQATYNTFSIYLFLMFWSLTKKTVMDHLLKRPK